MTSSTIYKHSFSSYLGILPDEAILLAGSDETDLFPCSVQSESVSYGTCHRNGPISYHYETETSPFTSKSRCILVISAENNIWYIFTHRLTSSVAGMCKNSLRLQSYSLWWVIDDRKLDKANKTKARHKYLIITSFISQPLL